MLQYWDHWAQSQRLFRVCGMSCWQSGHGNSQWIDFVAFFSCCISCQRSGHKCKWGHVCRSATWPGCYSCCTKRICRRRLRSKVNSVKLPALSKQNIIYSKLLNNSLIFIIRIHYFSLMESFSSSDVNFFVPRRKIFLYLGLWKAFNVVMLNNVVFPF